MSDAHPVIQLDGLSVRLGSRLILDDLRATLGGRAIGLLGPNGAGKTTLLRTLLGFYPIAGGAARVLSRSLATEGTAIRSLIGYMPESDAHIHNLSAIRFVRMMAELSGLPPGPALERAHEALFFVGLGEARYRLVGSFSTGMKQMVKLAQAIVHGPELLLLDEPTNGLDPPARKRMLELVAAICKQGETHVLLSSHLLHDVETVCDEVLILKGGRIAACCDLQAERRANRAFVELELSAANQPFADAVHALGCELASDEGRRFKIVLGDGVSVRELYLEAEQHGAVIRRLDCKRNSLQDIFLNAMEAGNGGL